MWVSLIANFAVVALVVAGWIQSQELVGRFRRQTRRITFGVVMGGGAVASMLLSVELRPGVLFDLRAVFVALAAFIGGPLSATLSALITGAYRFSLGGDGLLGASLSLILVVAVGLGGHALIGRRTPTIVQILLFSLTTSLVPVVGVATLPGAARLEAFSAAVVPMVVISFVAVLAALTSIAQSRRFVEERKLLLAALRQSPDYLFVKDRNSRFVAANEEVARVNGFSSPAELRGKSDFDIAPAERARQLFDEEQALIINDRPIIDLEEQVASNDGTRWYLTSKSPVHNIDGEVLGLAGVTRDITARKALEQALADSRNHLNLVMTEMADGIAHFDPDGRIIFCNRQYREMFPLTGSMRETGAYLPQILRAAYDLGEQLDVPADKVDRWIETIMASLRVGGEEEVRLFDGRWLHVRTTPIAEGGATVVVSDITTLKRAERKLLAMTEQLRQLAETDGLTGLLNRRSLDERLESELARARRTGQPTSVIMIDIDRFKAYNDHYGHPAGDDVIRGVAGAIVSKARRPADMVARYGGEEICVILPETAEGGAHDLAEKMRAAVRELAIVHQVSEKGVVTISVGVATCTVSDDQTWPDIVQRADQALYIAKQAGRDRVMVWSHRLQQRAS